MTANIKYLGNLRIEATHLKSGVKIITDAPTDNNGKGESFSPTDLVATALGSCMLTIMGIAAREHSIDIEGTEVSIHKIMVSDPRKIKTIELVFTMPSKNYSSKDRRILEAATRGCPVGNSIKEGIEKLTFNW